MTTDRPQRLVADATPPGEILKRPMQAATRLRVKDNTDRNPVYLALVRQCPCLACGDEPSEAAHLRMQSAAHGKRGGIGKKPADCWALPLCTADHRRQHDMGERAFWGYLKINPHLVAERLYAARSDLIRMREVVARAMAGHLE